MWGGGVAGWGGATYDFAVEHEWLARPAGRALWGTDTRTFPPRCSRAA
jgi:hypothetical protein